MGNKIMKAEATISNVFFKTNKKTYDAFQIELIKNGKSREETLTKLMDLYAVNGDVLWDLLIEKNFK